PGPRRATPARPSPRPPPPRRPGGARRRIRGWRSVRAWRSRHGGGRQRDRRAGAGRATTGGDRGRLRAAPARSAGPACPVAAGLGRLHDRPVGLTGMEERLLPIGIRQIDVDRLVPGSADAIEGRGEVVDFVRQMVRAGAVPGDEALEEVVALRDPRLEELDVHPGVSVAQAELHGPEAHALPAEEDDPAQLADEDNQRVAHIARREGYVVQIHAFLFYAVAGTGLPWPARVTARAMR